MHELVGLGHSMMHAVVGLCRDETRTSEHISISPAEEGWKVASDTEMYLVAALTCDVLQHPLTLNTCGRLGKSLMRLLGDVGQLLADRGQVLFSKRQFVRGVLGDLRVCFCRYNAMLERGVAGFFVKASGIGIKRCLTWPSTDVSDVD
jgi:hypothetical protein